MMQIAATDSTLLSDFRDLLIYKHKFRAVSVSPISQDRNNCEEQHFPAPPPTPVCGFGVRRFQNRIPGRL